MHVGVKYAVVAPKIKALRRSALDIGPIYIDTWNDVGNLV